MTNIQEIEIVMEKMIVLLRYGAHYGWADALEKFRSEIALEPVTTVRKILGMYGGMGSLNDLILYKNGQPLIKENNELDALRTQLYELCREIA